MFPKQKETWVTIQRTTHYFQSRGTPPMFRQSDLSETIFWRCNAPANNVTDWKADKLRIFFRQIRRRIFPVSLFLSLSLLPRTDRPPFFSYFPFLFFRHRCPVHLTRWKGHSHRYRRPVHTFHATVSAFIPYTSPLLQIKSRSRWSIRRVLSSLPRKLLLGEQEIMLSPAKYPELIRYDVNSFSPGKRPA